MWVFDLETLAFLAVNDAAVRLYGYSREEFLAMTLEDVRPRMKCLSSWNGWRLRGRVLRRRRRRRGSTARRTAPSSTWSQRQPHPVRGPARLADALHRRHGEAQPGGAARGRRRRWRRWAAWPAAWPTTSTTCWASSSATPSCCRRRLRRGDARRPRRVEEILRAGRAGRRPHAPAPGLQPQAGAAAAGARPQRRGGRHGEDAAPR